MTTRRDAPNVKPNLKRGAGVVRRELLATAQRMLAEQGVADKVSLRGIAAAVGVTAPAVYRHFPNKHALLHAAVAEQFRSFDKSIVAAAAQADGPFDALARAGHAYLTFGLSNPGAYRVLFGTPGGVEMGDAAYEACNAALQTLVGLIQRCIDIRAPGRRAGRTRREPEPFALAVEAWTLLHGQVDLRIACAGFPWPPLEAIFDDWTAKLRARLEADR